MLSACSCTNLHSTFTHGFIFEQHKPETFAAEHSGGCQYCAVQAANHFAERRRQPNFMNDSNLKMNSRKASIHVDATLASWRAGGEMGCTGVRVWQIAKLRRTAGAISLPAGTAAAATAAS
jgi:hypothetical protein